MAKVPLDDSGLTGVYFILPPNFKRYFSPAQEL
jgi:hypothetical protein